MSRSPHILLTRKFSTSRIEQLRKSGWKFIEHNFIEKKILYSRPPASLDYDIVLTSKTGVRAFMQLSRLWNLNPLQYRVSCISEGTKALAEKNGLQVQATAPDARLLADAIVKRQVRSVTYVCGNLQRKEGTEKLRQAGVEVHEWVTYCTELTPIHVDQPYHAVVFLSPSAVDSFLLKNPVSRMPSFCIGQTTAGHAARMGFGQIFTPDVPSEEALLTLLENYFAKVSMHAEK